MHKSLTTARPIILFFIAAVWSCSSGQTGTTTVDVAAATEAPQQGPRFPALYIDMDGTLLDSEASIRPETLAALAEYQACGGHVGIATGRTAEQVRPYLERVSPDLPLVLFNGAVTMDPTAERILQASTLSAEAVPAILARLSEDERVVGVFVQYAETTLAFPRSEALEEVARIIHTEIERSCETPESCIITDADGESQSPLKLLVVTDGDVAMAVAEAIRPDLPEGIRAVVGFPSAIEITAADVNKATAIGRILEERGIGRHDVVIFGDSGNDIEMVDAFPVSFAMEECHPETCARAMARAGSNDSDTIADIIRSLVMGPGCSPLATRP